MILLLHGILAVAFNCDPAAGKVVAVQVGSTGLDRRLGPALLVAGVFTMPSDQRHPSCNVTVDLQLELLIAISIRARASSAAL